MSLLIVSYALNKSTSWVTAHNAEGVFFYFFLRKLVQSLINGICLTRCTTFGSFSHELLGRFFPVWLSHDLPQHNDSYAPVTLSPSPLLTPHAILFFSVFLFVSAPHFFSSPQQCFTHMCILFYCSKNPFDLKQCYFLMLACLQLKHNH